MMFLEQELLPNLLLPLELTTPDKKELMLVHSLTNHLLTFHTAL